MTSVVLLRYFNVSTFLVDTARPDDGDQQTIRNALRNPARDLGGIGKRP
jgi:hypothetical protein